MAYYKDVREYLTAWENRGKLIRISRAVGTTDIYALGMQCKKEEIYGKWTQAQAHPIEPVTVSSEPCQERVIAGSLLPQENLPEVLS